MTIVNIQLEPRRALIAVDTLCRGSGGKLSPVTKILSLSHIGGVMVGRGVFGFMGIAFLRLASVPTFDIAQEVGLALLEDAWVDFERYVLSKFPAAAAGAKGGTEIYLVGWSERAGRMRAWCYEKAADVGPFTAEEITDNLAAPWHDRLSHLPVPRTRGEMLTFARAQVELGRELEPERNCGGRLMIAELTQHRLVLSDAGEIELDRAAAPAPQDAQAWLADIIGGGEFSKAFIA